MLSYLLLRGRCRACRAPIAVRYLVVEAGYALMLLGLVREFGVSLVAVRFAVLAFALLVVSFTDLEHHTIPNAVTYPGILAGLAFGAASGTLPGALVAALAAGGIFLIISVLSRGGLGGGDIKLAAMIGAFLGAPGVIVALVSAVALGAIAGITLIALRLRTRKDVIPFGPAMAAGAVIAMFGSDAIIQWYLSRVL